MGTYLLISYLNDFIFCPRSIYYHQLYGKMSTKTYHSSAQTKGLNAHASIDNQKYSTATNILQSIDVYSNKYNICGKIDTFDQDKNQLVERKKKISTIYDGFVFQLYAQYFCLTEMGYDVSSLKLYSHDDNKSYPITLPKDDFKRFSTFEELIIKIKNFDLSQQSKINPNKCARCIYNNLCDLNPC